MIPLTLPTRPDRPLLISFWLALCMFAWAALILLVILTGKITVGILTGVLLLAISVAGFFRGDHVARIYLLWNRAARKAGQIAERATLRVCYHVVLAPIGRVNGSKLPLRPPTPTASGWVAHGPGRRGTGAGAAAGSTYGSTLASLRGGWVTQLTERSIGSGRPWMLVLIPYLALLRCYAPSKADGTVLGNNYTLY